MPDKIKSEITRIDLNDATYRGTGVSIEPTYINYFFGNNGTGKSTIAKAIKSSTGVTYSPGKSAENYRVLVYDQDFITANMHSYHSLPGVFTINAVNVEIQRQIDEKTGELSAARTAFTEAKRIKGEKETEKANLLKQLYQDCWEKSEELRAEFDKTQDGKKKSKQFTEEVRAHNPIEHDLVELRRMYDSIYSDTAKVYSLFRRIEDERALDDIEGNDILEVSIVNAADTDLAAFLKEVGSTEWVRQGHEDFHVKAGDRCPFCSQDLPTGFEATLTASFDTRYQDNLRKLDEFLVSYRTFANTLFTSLSAPEEVYPVVDPKPYNDKLAALKGVVSTNIEKIKEKVDEPARTVVLDDTTKLLHDLSEMIAGFNSLISVNNENVSAGPRKKTDCRNKVFELLAFKLKDVIDAYIRNDTTLDSEIEAQQTAISTHRETMERLNAELRELNSQTVETETAMDNINTMLRDSGFQGFQIRPRAEEIRHPDGTVEWAVPVPAINYEVIRTDTGEIAENLSEGEKNFIAFLYFQQMVFGSETADGDNREKIAVIDDPVSSMDSSALFIVSAQVRKMIEICRNNADNRNPLVPGNFIKQIFILTHNAYFHREVTYAYANRYEYVSFYLIRKSDNHSFVRLCDCQNPNCPTERMNVNPVKNSYAALWEEYKEVNSGIPLMNVIRRILEYYFLQLCGYEGNDLRQRILVEKKDIFIHDDEGNEDYTKFDMASAMLSYIAANASGVNDGMNYVDDCVDVEVCRETFRMIFRYMEQEQHFSMMMGIQ